MPGDDILTILRKELADLLSEEDVPHGAACAITEKLVQRVVGRCGGDRLFVPRVDRRKRDAAILADWKKGDSLEVIAKRHEVDRSTVYRIIERRNQRGRKTGTDGGGFGSEDWNL